MGEGHCHKKIPQVEIFKVALQRLPLGSNQCFCRRISEIVTSSCMPKNSVAVHVHMLKVFTQSPWGYTQDECAKVGEHMFTHALYIYMIIYLFIYAHKQTQTNKEGSKRASKQTKTNTHTNTQINTSKQTHRQTNKHTSTQTNTQTNKHAGWLTLSLPLSLFSPWLWSLQTGQASRDIQGNMYHLRKGS